MRRIWGFCAVQLMLVLVAGFNLATAQDEAVPVECGSIVEGEFTTTSRIHRYALELSPGDTVTYTFNPLGDGLRAVTTLRDPADNGIKGSSFAVEAEVTALIGGRGTHFIVIEGEGTRTGIYTVTVKCILRDGTVIEPGALPLPPAPNPVVIQPPSFGFPGLAPVDFVNAVKLPLIPATPMTGAISPTGGEVFGFQIEGSAGDVLDLSLMRISGNLNLGMVVLSGSNEVVSYGGLISGDTFSTRLTLPSAGQYTIGVFRIDLLPPGDPQAAAFQVTGTLNP